MSTSDGTNGPEQTSQMVKYVYICAAGHSGSTLLDLMLGAHPRIASLGEVDQLSKNFALNTVCSCGVPVRSCPLWSAVAEKVSKQLEIDVLARPYALHMGFPRATVVIDKTHQTSAYLARRTLILGAYFLHLRIDVPIPAIISDSVLSAIDNTVRVLDASREVLDADAVVDSSKSYLKALALYKRYPDSVRILLLTRDGRGVTWSNMKRGVSRARSVREWRNQYARALPLLQKHVRAGHLLQVRYEELVRSPNAVLSGICRFIGQSFYPQMVNFRSKVNHVANGNDMRMQESAVLKIDDEWQRKLQPDDLRFFESRAGSLNRALGYQ
jgi:hypothetical protein